MCVCVRERERDSIYLFIIINFLDKLQITPLKFGSDGILHFEISEFEFLHPDVLEFKFYILKF